MNDLTDDIQEAMVIGMGFVLWLSILSRDCVLGKTPCDVREHAWKPTALYLEKTNIEIFLYRPLDKGYTYNLQLFISQPFEKGYTIAF